MNGREVHRGGTVVLAVAMVAIGIALLVEALSAGKALSLLTLAGVLFLAAGAGRIYIEARRGRRA
ncbi:MAG: hypothetical protein ACYCU0_01930 [Solirubrobacteraceae bacterium]